MGKLRNLLSGDLKANLKIDGKVRSLKNTLFQSFEKAKNELITLVVFSQSPPRQKNAAPLILQTENPKTNVIFHWKKKNVRR